MFSLFLSETCDMYPLLQPLPDPLLIVTVGRDLLPTLAVTI